MQKKYIGYIFIFISLIAGAIIVYILFFNDYPVSNITNNLKKIIPAEKNKNDNPAASTQPIKKIEFKEGEKPAGEEGKTEPKTITKTDLSRIAASFAERFGSYSNQSNFSNIGDLKIFMSKKMQAWADKYVNEQKNLNKNNEVYYGITTKAVAEEVKEFDDEAGIASIVVKTRRREAATLTKNTTNAFNQSVVINFVKENGAWKVDAAYWQQ